MWYVSSFILNLINSPVAKMIRDYLKTIKYGIRSPREPSSLRNTLTHRRDAVEYSKSMIAARLAQPYSTPPLCTVIFELVGISTDRMVCYELAPRSGDFPKGTFRIAYHRAYPCTQASHSVTTFLESNLSFRGKFKTGVSIRHMPRLKGIPEHSLRILPLFQERRSPVRLPQNIICNIAKYAVRGHGHGWRTALLKYGLVSRSWSCVHSLFFDIYSSINNDKATAASVASSLERRPGWERFMHRFTPWNLAIDETNDGGFLASSQALVKILSLAISLRDINVQCMHESMLQELVHALEKLRKVQRFMVSGHPGSWVASSKSMSVDNVQTVIARWSNLRACEIHSIPEDEGVMMQ